MINLTTGPVTILPEVARAFAEPPISHRSQEFMELYNNVAIAICDKLNVKKTFMVTGSGTLANEIMIGQIAMRKDHGLILSNGEFGERLINQAKRQNLNFEVLHAGRGQVIDTEAIASALNTRQIKWLLFCHCESSTGMLNPMNTIIDLCRQNSCEPYVDCMSTFGTTALNLADVAMATASSGKAIGSIAGLALIFSNKEVIDGGTLPLYIDLFHIYNSGGVPFTLSSNLLGALNEAVKHNLNEKKWAQLSIFSELVYTQLNSLQLVPFSAPDDRIFTIIPKNRNAGELAEEFCKKGIQLSWQSNYLIKNNWVQLALFGSYAHEEINAALHCFNENFAALPAISD